MAEQSNPVGWFEIPVSDLNRAKAFYEHVLGVSLAITNMEGSEMAWFPMHPGGAGAGGTLIKGEGYEPSSGRDTCLPLDRRHRGSAQASERPRRQDAAAQDQHRRARLRRALPGLGRQSRRAALEVIHGYDRYDGYDGYDLLHPVACGHQQRRDDEEYGHHSRRASGAQAQRLRLGHQA